MCVDEAMFTNNQNHLVGPQVEFAYPRELESNEDLSAQLPFMALPDGSHMVCDTQLHLVWRGLLLFSLILSLTTTKHDLWYLMQSTNPGGRAY